MNIRDIRMTHTFVKLPVTDATYHEIHSKLKQAGYEHCFVMESNGIIVIDMQGIAVTQESKDDDV